MSKNIAKPITLPCGATIKNRLCKTSMTEGLADPLGQATKYHNTLYHRWAKGGAGLLLSGNVQIDRRYLERPGNIVIDGPQSDEQLQALHEFAASATSDGTHAWPQLSHAGRQTPKSIAAQPVGPSTVKLALPGGQFGKPRALEHEEIEEIIQRFADAATVCQQVGFTGVQVHGAHGYLLSAFLNPKVNLRTDQWGGSLENRARLLLRVVRAIRNAVGAEFPLGVKLNSSDFQQGGYSFEDCQKVVHWLDQENIDLLEISGGNYEQPQMMNLAGIEPVVDNGISQRSAKREAYFLGYAKTISANTRTPLLVTGGFRSLEGMEAALEEGSCDMIGLGRPLCVDPDAPGQLLNGKIDVLEKWENTLAMGKGWLGPQSKIKLIKVLNGFGTMAFYYRNIDLIATEQKPERDMNLFKAFINLQLSDQKKAKAIKRAYQNS